MVRYAVANTPYVYFQKSNWIPIYQSAFADLKDAFSRWRKGLAEFPKKKSKHEGDSFTVYKTSGIYPQKG
jgi:putative transposase